MDYWGDRNGSIRGQGKDDTQNGGNRNGCPSGKGAHNDVYFGTAVGNLKLKSSAQPWKCGTSRCLAQARMFCTHREAPHIVVVLFRKCSVGRVLLSPTNCLASHVGEQLWQATLLHACFLKPISASILARKGPACQTHSSTSGPKPRALRL